MFVFARRIYLRLQNDDFPPLLGVIQLLSLVFLNFVRKWGGFDIHFRKSGGAREKTNFLKRFIAISTTKIQKEFPFRILLVEILPISR